MHIKFVSARPAGKPHVSIQYTVGTICVEGPGEENNELCW
jgi:hypothetical protein